jgi:WD40 repeat protein
VRHIGEQLQELQAVAYSPDGKSLASGGGDGVVRLWDVATGKMLHEFRGHRGLIWCIAFSPDGRTVASGGEDTTILLWDVRAAQRAPESE